ncbi:hypothetical protein ADK35_02190 [Streptomyces viridochromogenes]|uniref:hypothetical protein n=1 Tax=Streptomyces viridochromogenes TaxID=1938 RepID=UPI00069E9DC6|nr:hypothetical protein [Streptomyces viridochromogenes]KOG29520.1 hypothetical protein ADK35_02190 [Streptomyces viridochromogenes]
MNRDELLQSVDYLEAVVRQDAARLAQIRASVPAPVTLDFIAAGFALHWIASVGQVPDATMSVLTDLRRPAPIAGTLDERLLTLYAQTLLHWARHRGNRDDDAVARQVLGLIRATQNTDDAGVLALLAAIRDVPQATTP